MRILLVEPEGELSQLVYDTLTSADLEVETVATCSEAIGKVAGGRPVILATSWENQNLATTELLQQLISDGIVNAYVILLLKANATADDVMRGLKVGADDFVFQSNNRAELIMRFGIAERIMDLKSVNSPASPATVTAPNFSRRRPAVRRVSRMSR